MQHVTSDGGTTIGYLKSGSGPPLLLVHGTTADHRRWDPILALLEPYLSVYAVDRRGRGASGDSPHHDLQREAEGVARELAASAEDTFRPESVAGVHVPTTLMLGGESPDTFRRAIQVVDVALPQGRVVVLPGQQHIAMDIVPEAFVNVLLGALLPG